MASGCAGGTWPPVEQGGGITVGTSFGRETPLLSESRGGCCGFVHSYTDVCHP